MVSQTDSSKRKSNTVVSSLNHTSHFSLPSIQQESTIQEQPPQSNSFFKFAAKKNDLKRSNMIDHDSTAQGSSPARVSGGSKNRIRSSVTQSQIIYKSNEQSNMVEGKQVKAMRDQAFHIDSNCFNELAELENEEEEEYKASSSNLAASSNDSDLRKKARHQKPGIFQMQSMTYKKPYRELGDLQHLHTI